jgi:hypothetical protein
MAWISDAEFVQVRGRLWAGFDGTSIERILVARNARIEISDIPVIQSVPWALQEARTVG